MTPRSISLARRLSVPHDYGFHWFHTKSMSRQKGTRRFYAYIPEPETGTFFVRREVRQVLFHVGSG